MKPHYSPQASLKLESLVPANPYLLFQPIWAFFKPCASFLDFHSVFYLSFFHHIWYPSYFFWPHHQLFPLPTNINLRLHSCSAALWFLKNWIIEKMQRILSLPVLALLALAFSTLMANGFIDRRQAEANTTTDSTKAAPATATDLKPVTDSSTSTEAHPAGSTTDSKASTNTSALPTSALPTTGTTSTSGSITTPPAPGAASTGGATVVMPTAAGSANHSTSSVSHDKSSSTNTTKTVPPAGAKHSSAGQISCNFVVTLVVASLSLFAALFT